MHTNYPQKAKIKLNCLILKGFKLSETIPQTIPKIKIMTSEHEIQSRIMLAVSQAGCTIIRTNVGKVRTADGRMFSAGPPPGWPDLTGFRHSDGKIILLEIKNEKGRLREDQKRFAEFIKDKPVLYGVCRSVEDALNVVRRR